MAVIGGVERKAHYLTVDLLQSDDCFAMAFPAETMEAFLEGHGHAFAYFGGVPRTILYRYRNRHGFENGIHKVGRCWLAGEFKSRVYGSPLFLLFLKSAKMLNRGSKLCGARSEKMIEVLNGFPSGVLALASKGH